MSVTIEVRLRPVFQGSVKGVVPLVRDWVAGNYESLSKGQNIDAGCITGSLLDQVDHIFVSDTSDTGDLKGVHVPTAKISVHPYKYFKSLPRIIRIPMEGETGHCGPTVLVRELPSMALADSWDQLFFQPDIKSPLLRFVTSISAQGLSGRALRRTPLLMHASSTDDGPMNLFEALEAMLQVVENEQASTQLAVKDIIELGTIV
ncbi:hypothetical protein H072_1481 [Dactylellina haptotyla CBS 200.50]|uniref:Pachytene checkpoint protein 2 C-terminal domain-containing protein n=1 Tax=Dactylellina haptotyla (strain CBS 200.50) TaxID=1284197 RepID=S8BYF9_DACHA|nr:hypothetical protein H072_1481 [Dactylellina haptotyla CBS 200.50]